MLTVVVGLSFGPHIVDFALRFRRPAQTSQNTELWIAPYHALPTNHGFDKLPDHCAQVA